jgi:microcystin-dependent protein
MSTPFVGEIRMFAGSFAPLDWMFCEGQLLPISENETLFTLIGTTYGGDGQQTFGLPDLRGRVPIHMGNGAGLSNRIIGEMSGVETVTLNTNQIPAHSHTFLGTSSTASATSPANNVVATPSSIDLYRPTAVPAAAMAANALGVQGGSQPHENMQPFLCVSFIISLFGIFPNQN